MFEGDGRCSTRELPDTPVWGRILRGDVGSARQYRCHTDPLSTIPSLPSLAIRDSNVCPLLRNLAGLSVRYEDSVCLLRLMSDITIRRVDQDLSSRSVTLEAEPEDQSCICTLQLLAKGEDVG